MGSGNEPVLPSYTIHFFFKEKVLNIVEANRPIFFECIAFKLLYDKMEIPANIFVEIMQTLNE